MLSCKLCTRVVAPFADERNEYALPDSETSGDVWDPGGPVFLTSGATDPAAAAVTCESSAAFPLVSNFKSC